MKTDSGSESQISTYLIGRYFDINSDLSLRISTLNTAHGEYTATSFLPASFYVSSFFFCFFFAGVGRHCAADFFLIRFLLLLLFIKTSRDDMTYALVDC